MFGRCKWGGLNPERGLLLKECPPQDVPYTQGSPCGRKPSPHKGRVAGHREDQGARDRRGSSLQLLRGDWGSLQPWPLGAPRPALAWREGRMGTSPHLPGLLPGREASQAQSSCCPGREGAGGALRAGSEASSDWSFILPSQGNLSGPMSNSHLSLLRCRQILYH